MAAVCLLFLAGGTAGAAETYPAGVGQPAPGVYSAVDEPGCCWLRPSAHFVILQPPQTDTVTIDFAIPPFAAGAKPTALTLTLNGISRRACCYGVGEHEAAFHFPKWAGSTRQADVVIESSSQFVPAQRGLNQDRRVLTVLLKRVTTVDSTSGEVYVAGSPVSANLLLPRWRVILDAAGLALAAGLMVFLLTRRPKYAWIAVVLAAPFLLPIPIYGTTISLEKVVIILAALVMLAQKRFRSAVLTGPGRWILAALALFVAEMALSSWTAAFHGAAIRETLKVAEYVLVFAVVYGTFLMDPDETALQTTLAWIICAVSILALAQPIFEPVQRTVFQGHVVPRLAGPLEGPNQLSAFLGVTLIAAVALPRKFSGGLVFGFVLGGLALALTISRGGIASFLLALAVVTALKKWPLRSSGILAGVTVLCGALVVMTIVAAVAFPNAALDRIFGAADAYNGGLGSRAALWHAAVVLWRAHPVFGAGPGNYELLVGTILPGVRTHPNGYFFQVLAEQGVAGVVLLLGLIVAPAIVYARNVPSRFALAGMGVLIVLTFHQLVDGLFPYPKVAIEYWALIAIAAAAVAVGTESAHRSA